MQVLKEIILPPFSRQEQENLDGGKKV